MSDQVDEAAPADPVPTPQVTLVPRNEGGYVGLMHLGDTVRTFIANEIAHARKLIASAGIAEFGMDQASADALADSAVQAHADQAVASVHADAPVDEAAEAEAQSAAEPVEPDEEDAADTPAKEA